MQTLLNLIDWNMSPAEAGRSLQSLLCFLHSPSSFEVNASRVFSFNTDVWVIEPSLMQMEGWKNVNFTELGIEPYVFNFGVVSLISMDNKGGLVAVNDERKPDGLSIVL
eukprot:TRINITY_DN7302_c0_g1_i2.p2 TRINITY_DN7302_c0_g1~~TRINITY_DN7302_c0_g1_i2.p2  ORF type:complete len:109 (+),score=35.60 TRINITY_DN7302_c0_g1_i2:610-936(+)